MTVDLFSTWHSFTCSRKKRKKFHEFLSPNNSQYLNFSLEHRSSFQTHNSLLTDYHLVVLIGGGRGGGRRVRGFRAFATLKATLLRVQSTCQIQSLRSGQKVDVRQIHISPPFSKAWTIRNLLSTLLLVPS